MRKTCEARFTAGGASLGGNLVRAWGVIVNPCDGTYSVTADRAVDDEDASFCGHCWVEIGPSFDVTVVDVVTGYVGPRVVRGDLVVYHPVRTLSASIRRKHGRVMGLVGKGASRDPFLTEFFSSLVV